MSTCRGPGCVLLLASALLFGCSDEASPKATAVDAGTPAPAPADAAPPSDDRGALAFTGPDPAARFAAYEAALRNTAYVSPEGLAAIETTFDAELARARKRFIEAKTPSDVYYALLSLKNAAHDAHASFFHDPSGPLKSIPDALVPSTPPVALPISVRVEYEGESPVYVVEGKGILPGSVVESVDGVAVGELRAIAREWYPLHAPEGLNEFVAGFISYRDPTMSPAPNAGDKSELKVRSGSASGAARDVTLDWEKLSGGGGSPPNSCCEAFGSADIEADYASKTPVKSGANYCVYDTANATVVRYCSFYYSSRSALVTDQTGLLDHLASQPPTKLLFDVRENGGGDFDPEFFGAFATSAYEIPTKALYFAPAFRSDPALLDQVSLFMDPMPDPVGAYRTEMLANPAATYSAPRPFFCSTPACAASEATFAGKATAPLYPIAVLTGPSCLSACDDFVSIMARNGLAKTVGVASAAADSPFRFPIALELANGTSFDLEVTVGVSYHPKGGAILEGNPVPVVVPVRPTAANRGSYLASALSALGW